MIHTDVRTPRHRTKYYQRKAKRKISKIDYENVCIYIYVRVLESVRGMGDEGRGEHDYNSH